MLYSINYGLIRVLFFNLGKETATRGTGQIGVWTHICLPITQAEYDTAQLLKQLEQRGVILRTFSKLPGFYIFPHWKQLNDGLQLTNMNMSQL